MAESNDFFYLEAFVFSVHKMISVSEEYLSFDAPMVIDKVRIVEIHAPTFALGREAAKKKDFGVFGQERNKRVVFYFGGASGYVVGVEIVHGN